MATMSLLCIEWMYPDLVETMSSENSPGTRSSDFRFGSPPCATTISMNFLWASPDSRISLALAEPLGMPAISRIIPAQSQAFSTTLAGCFSPSRILMHSLASSFGPTALPTGWSAYVMAHSTCIPSFSPRSIRSRA